MRELYAAQSCPVALVPQSSAELLQLLEACHGKALRSGRGVGVPLQKLRELLQLAEEGQKQTPPLIWFPVGQCLQLSHQAQGLGSYGL